MDQCKKRIGLASVLAALVMMAAAPIVPALAQLAPADIPGQADPALGEVEMLDFGDFSEFDFSIELPGGNQAPEGAESTFLTLNDIILSGMTLYDESELRALFEDRLGQDVAVSTIYDIAHEIENKYRSDGYLLSYAYIPPHEVEDGVTRITIVEGFFDSVLVEGVDGKVKNKIEQIFADLPNSGPPRSDDLFRRLLLVRDLTGVNVSSVMQPSPTTSDATQLVLKVEFDPMEFSLEIDNRGSKYAGPWRATVQTQANSVVMGGDQLGVKATVTKKPEESRSVSLFYGVNPGSDGVKLSVSGSYTETVPGYDLQHLYVKGRSISMNLAASYPIILQRNLRLTALSSFNWRNTRINALGGKLTHDRVRSMTLGGHLRYGGLLGGQSMASFSLVQGIPFLGTSDPEVNSTSASDAAPDFTLLKAELYHRQPLFDRFYLQTNVKGQYSFDPLFSGDNFTVGGALYGSAYDSAELTGDRGVAFNASLFYELDINKYFVKRFTPYIYIDGGSVWDLNTPSGGQQTALSTGTGFGLELDYGISTTFEYALPMTRPQATEAGEMDERMYFGLKAKYPY